MDGGIPHKMDSTLRHARSAWYDVDRPFGRGIFPSTEKVLHFFYLSFNLKRIKISKIQFDVDVAYGVAFYVANDVLPVWWMEVYPFRFRQSKSLLHAEIMLLRDSMI